MKLYNMNLRLFDNTNKTTDAGLSDEMKTFYSDYLIDMAEPELVHDQFGQKKPIPKNNGKTIEFRKYAPLPKAKTPLAEGVTPNGQKLNVSVVTATVDQYGGYVELSDVLLLTAIDNNLVEATALLGSQAGRTLDTVTREKLCSGTNVMYAQGPDGSVVTSRSALVGGAGSNNNYLTVQDVKRAVRALKKMNTPKFNGSFWGIINQDVTFDLVNDPEWKYPHQYRDTKEIYEGEIGMIAGVRFAETPEAKLLNEAGYSDRDVYCTLIGGANAYGVTEITGGGLEHIVKPVGSAGAADPLNQRGTAGWKATKVAEILVDEYLVRIESTSSFSDSDEDN